MLIKASASNARPTTTNAPQGVDVDVSVFLTPDPSEQGSAKNLLGTITLVPDDDRVGRMIAYGNEPSHWVSEDLMLYLRWYDALTLRMILEQVLAAGVGEALGLGSSGGVVHAI